MNGVIFGEGKPGDHAGCGRDFIARILLGRGGHQSDHAEIPHACFPQRLRPATSRATTFVAPVVNRENSWNTGLNYSVTKDTELSLDWRHLKRADILLPAAYDFTEDSARIGVGHNFGKLQMQSFLDLGTLDNSLTGEGG